MHELIFIEEEKAQEQEIVAWEGIDTPWEKGLINYLFLITPKLGQMCGSIGNKVNLSPPSAGAWAEHCKG